MWQNFLILKSTICYIVSDGMCWTCLLLSGIYIYIYISCLICLLLCLACVEMQKWTVDVSEDFLETNFNPINWDYNSIGVGVKLRIMMYIDFKIWLLTRSLWIGNLDQMSGSTYVLLILYVYILKILNQLSLWVDKMCICTYSVSFIWKFKKEKKNWLEDSKQIEFFCSWEANEGTLSFIDFQGQAHINQPCMMLCDAFLCNFLYWYAFKTMDYADFITWTAILVSTPEGLWAQMYCGR